MPAHNVFTEIDARSYAAIVKNGWLSEVLLALLVDPLEAADVAESIQRIQETRIELAFDGKIIDAPITLKDFQNLPSKHAFEKLKITVSQWVMTTESASDALRVLRTWDRGLGVWCACAVARESLRYVPAGEQRPLRAIEAAELWLIGEATIDTVMSAANAADRAADAALAADVDADVAAANDAYAYAATSAARAAYTTRDSYAAFAYYAVVNAARAAYADEYRALQDAELIRLREVVSKACLTFPG